MKFLGRVLPAPVLEPVKASVRRWEGQPPVDGVDFGDLRQVRPVSRAFGADRGQAIDRYYVERFLDSCREDIRGGALEIGEDCYTPRYGGGRIDSTDVLHVRDRDRQVTIVGDLSDAPHVSDESFGLTQTLQLFFYMLGAMGTLNRILAPGGVLLLTVPGISQVAADREWGKTCCWASTGFAVERFLREGMRAPDITAAIHGNLLAETALLHGLATSEVTAGGLDAMDPDYQLLITARAVKGAAPS